MQKFFCIVLFLFFGMVLAAPAQDQLERFNVIWDSPSEDRNGSMPIGNGDIGANVWVEEGGDLLFIVSKTDAYSENTRLLKLGKIRVSLSPNPFDNGCSFNQELDLRNGVIAIKASGKNTDNSADLRFWVDANNPVIRVEGGLTEETTITVTLEHWRTERTKASVADRSFSGLIDRDSEDGGFPFPVFVEPDIVMEGRENAIVWYHRNTTEKYSIWEETMRVQGLEGFMEQSEDPLKDLTFGALVKGKELRNISPESLRSAKPTKNVNLSVFPYTEMTNTVEEWIGKVEEITSEYEEKSAGTIWTEHTAWWNAFWDRSWIYMDSYESDDAYNVNRGYILQNWITACGGRGNMPIRFNGSIFSVYGVQPSNGVDYTPDYLAWGSAFWWQNTRLSYWPMIASGNYEMILPLFDMYLDALPLAKYRIQTHYGFEGAWFPETMYKWGVYRNEDYGWHPEKDRDPDIIRGHHIRYEWQGGIEMTAMMLKYFRHTLDTAFLENSILPFAKQITKFYDNRYSRNKEGKLIIFPANALEDVWHCTNPTPEIAGLKFILPQLAEYAKEESEKEYYTRLYNEIPPLETDISPNGQEYILPAREAEKRRGNCEKPECYVLFPYRQYGVGLPGLDVAKETFRLSPRAMRGFPRTDGWVQDAIFAACCGNTYEAKEMIIKRSKHIHPESRFPGFWDVTYAYVPNQDHGGVNMIALQHMLLQTDPWSDKIHLFPAWPKEWNCSFKLHAPGKTIVEGKVKNGEIVDLKVTPESRRKDILNYLE